MMHLADRIHAGQASAGRMWSYLHIVASQMKGKCLCALGEFSIEAVHIGYRAFPALIF
jgi:NADH:ubiquinone oxidoreductase subunit F (NADH-binding)